MFKIVTFRQRRDKRHRRVRQKVRGTQDRPRLSVFRSLNHLYAQLVDDVAGRSLVAASTRSPELRGQLDGANKTAHATLVGRLLAQKAQERGISRVVFDRAGYCYHGRVRALAEGAREGGLIF